MLVKLIEWIAANGTDIVAILAGLIGVAEIIVRLTPTPNDDTFLSKVKGWLDFIIPNMRSYKPKDLHNEEKIFTFK